MKPWQIDHLLTILNGQKHRAPTDNLSQAKTILLVSLSLVILGLFSIAALIILWVVPVAVVVGGLWWLLHG